MRKVLAARFRTRQLCTFVSELTYVARAARAPHDRSMTHSPLVMIATGVAVFLLAAISDFLETKYVAAVGEQDARRAARCSVAMWLVGVIGLVAVLEVGWWVVAPEGAGLYVGTRLAMRG